MSVYGGVKRLGPCHLLSGADRNDLTTQHSGGGGWRGAHGTGKHRVARGDSSPSNGEGDRWAGSIARHECAEPDGESSATEGRGACRKNRGQQVCPAVQAEGRHQGEDDGFPGYQIEGQTQQKITIDVEPKAPGAADAGAKPVPDPGAAAGFRRGPTTRAFARSSCCSCSLSFSSRRWQ